MFRRKAQASVEFLLIMIFISVVISSLMYVIGVYSLDLKNSEQKDLMNNFVDSILSEIQIMQNVEGGYYRELIVPYYLTQRYNLSVRDNYLIVLNLEIVDLSMSSDELFEASYFYELPETGVSFIYNITSGDAKFIFEKNNSIDYSDVILIS